MKAPLPPDETQRLAALRDYAVLDTLPEAAFDDLALLASQICQTPIAVISLIDETRQWFKARGGLPATETPRDIAFCAHAILQPTEVLEVPDARADPRFSSNPLVTGDPHLRFYAGAPLVTPDGRALGTICTLDRRPRSLTDEQRRALSALSRQVVAQLELRRHAHVLTREVDERQQVEIHLRVQMDELAVRKMEAENFLLQVQQSRRALLGVVEDQKATEQALRESEAHFRVLFENSPYCIHEIDRDGRFTQMNPAGLKMMGAQEVRAVCGLPYLSAVADEDKARIGELLNAAFQGQASEFEFRASNGTAYLSSFVPITDAAGAVIRLMGLTQDITARKLAEAALRESEERYRLALSGANDAIWDWDLGNHRVFFSLRWKEMRGLTAEEVTDREEEWSGGIHPEDSPRVWAAVQAHFAGKTALFAEEYRTQHKDGSWIWILDRGQAWRNAAGKVVRMTGSETDITARKQAEQSLALFRTLIDQAGDTIEVVDPATGRFLDMNARGCLELGYTKQEILALTVSDIDSTWGVEGFGKFVAQLRSTGLIELETQHRRKDGTMFPVEIACRMVRLDREYIVTMSRDITARKAAKEALRTSESRYRRVMLGTSEGLWEWNIATGQEYCSPRWLEMLGYDPDETVRDFESFTALIHPDDAAHVMATSDAAIRDRKPFRTEMQLRRKDGSYLWVLSRAVVDYDPDGKPLTMTGSIADLTATRAIEQQLRQSQKLEAIGTLAGGIAHDFNNILSGIYGYTSLARSAAGGNKELLDYLGEIGQAGRRAAELVQQILVFSRTRGGDDHMEPVPLDRIVNEAVKLLRAASPTTIAFRVQAAKALPAVLANPAQLHQVVMNLGTNAVHAMRNRSGVQLSLLVETCSADEALAQELPGLAVGPCVRLTIRDTGHGMDAATQARVFEPFFTTKGPGEGTGLGLSVVHGIVRNHHGAIRLTSEVGRGTSFEIFLPAAAGAKVEPSPEPTARPRGHGERVLLVDDEAAIVNSGKLALTQLGYRAVGETSVLAALARLERDPQAFDLVISDLTMPAMTGLELAERLLVLRSDLPVVIASGHSGAVTPERIMAAGVREVMSKPYSLDELATAIRRHLAPKP